MKYPRGAEWRKWDLHVHSPESAFANEYEGSTPDEKWENYLNCLEQLEDIAVVGVTDYFSIDGYIKAKEFKEAGRLANIDLLLPNVEFRLDHSTREGTAINIHVLFHPSVVEFINDIFFNNLKFSYRDNEYNCTRESLARLGRVYREDNNLEENAAFKAGANQFKVSVDHLKDVLTKNYNFRGKYLIVVPNSNRDGNSGLREENLRALREELYRLAHCIFSSNPNDRTYFLGDGPDPKNEIIHKYGALKPCIHGSDSHSLNNMCVPNDERFTWIKADPSFEGLKQILFEPEDRVRIQKDSPALDYPKAHFSSIRACGNIFDDEKPCFQECSIPLNPNLVTLIGGRGTGKSLLLDVMHRTFYQPSLKNKSHERLSRIGSPKFDITLTKSDGEETPFLYGDESNSFEYLHVRQGEVKDVAENKRELGEAIKNLLGFIQNDSCSSVSKTIIALNRDQNDLQKWFEERDVEGNLTNSEQYQRNRKKNIQGLKDTITTEATREKITSFSSNSSQIGKLKKAQKDSTSLREDLKASQLELNQKIDLLNKKDVPIDLRVDQVDFSAIKSQLKAYEIAVAEKIKSLGAANSRISEELLARGIKGDISGLLDKVSEYQQSIEKCDSVLEDIATSKTKLRKVCQDRVALAESIVVSIEEEQSSFKKKFAEIAQGSPGMTNDHKEILQELLKNIEIKGDLLFDKEVFWDGLNDFFDGRRIKKDVLKEVFPIHSAEDYFALILNAPMVQVQANKIQCLTDFVSETELFLKQDIYGFYNFIYSEDSRNKYFQVVPSIKYFGKEPHQLSVGQRGTFYVCLKLATSAFLTPFVFDQPEDDLDNAFIVEELEPIFRKIKKHRQVIIVTHNASLVVNSDAEQIIIATNDDEKISYKSGSLECPEIRREVCRILEGGETAFKKREMRYELI